MAAVARRKASNKKRNTPRRDAADARRIASQRRRYLAAQPPRVRKILKQLRQTIGDAIPGAVEAFSYGIPGFRFEGRVPLWYAGWRQHVSLYPMTGTITRQLAGRLDAYAQSKGTIRFPLDAPVPLNLVARLARARASDVRRAS
jgi:uncharacterized protein YdhG (YjbR/CyaY superfamily)